MPSDEPFEPAGQFCPDCTCNNLLSATQCEVCGAPLRGRPAPSAPEPGDPVGEVDEEASDSLDVILSDQRASVGHFPTDYEANLAAGLLRAQGIAVEMAPPPIWGGPKTLDLWVSREEAEQAGRILAEVTRSASPHER